MALPIVRLFLRPSLQPQQYLPIRVPDITKVPPDLQNLHYLLLVGRQPPQSVTPGIVQGLMSILRGSGKCSPFLLRGAILSLARLLHKVEDEGPGRRILSDLRACKQMAFAALKEIWMQNENSDVRDAAELGLKLVGGEYGCRLIQVCGVVRAVGWRRRGSVDLCPARPCPRRVGAA